MSITDKNYQDLNKLKDFWNKSSDILFITNSITLYQLHLWLSGLKS